MVLSEKALRRLFPQNSHAFKLPGTIGQVISALSFSFERLRTFFLQILTESLPYTAVITLPAWFQALGLTYDSTQTLAANQATADAAWSQSGGQSLNYLNAQIQKELPQVYIQENLYPGGPTTASVSDGRMNVGHIGIMRVNFSDSTMIYSVLGTAPDRTRYNRLLAILARIAPLHLYPSVNVIIISEIGLARMFIAQLNNARLGKGS